MNPEPMEILSAFVDGEAVADSDLSDALSRPGALDTLVDFIRLRTAVHDDHSETSPRFREELGRLLATASAPRPNGRRAIVLGIAASLLVGLGLAAGWAVHPRVGEQRSPLPPEATREIHFTEGVDWWRRS